MCTCLCGVTSSSIHSFFSLFGEDQFPNAILVTAKLRYGTLEEHKRCFWWWCFNINQEQKVLNRHMRSLLTTASSTNIVGHQITFFLKWTQTYVFSCYLVVVTKLYKLPPTYLLQHLAFIYCNYLLGYLSQGWSNGASHVHHGFSLCPRIVPRLKLDWKNDQSLGSNTNPWWKSLNEKDWPCLALARLYRTNKVNMHNDGQLRWLWRETYPLSSLQRIQRGSCSFIDY